MKKLLENMWLSDPTSFNKFYQQLKSFKFINNTNKSPLLNNKEAGTSTLFTKDHKYRTILLLKDKDWHTVSSNLHLVTHMSESPNIKEVWSLSVQVLECIFHKVWTFNQYANQELPLATNNGLCQGHSNKTSLITWDTDRMITYIALFFINNFFKFIHFLNETIMY